MQNLNLKSDTTLIGNTSDLLSMIHLVYSAQRMERMHIVASDIQPPIASGWNFGHASYGRECAYSEAAPPSAVRHQYICDGGAIGQFVYLWFETSQQTTICEVEVYGTGRFNSYRFNSM